MKTAARTIAPSNRIAPSNKSAKGNIEITYSNSISYYVLSDSSFITRFMVPEAYAPKQKLVLSGKNNQLQDQ